MALHCIVCHKAASKTTHGLPLCDECFDLAARLSNTPGAGAWENEISPRKNGQTLSIEMSIDSMVGANERTAIWTAANIAETWRLRIQVIDIDLDVATTFVEIAQVDIHADSFSSRQLITKAKKAHEATGKFLAKVEDGAAYQRLADRRKALGRSIQEVERMLDLEIG